MSNSDTIVIHTTLCKNVDCSKQKQKISKLNLTSRREQVLKSQAIHKKQQRFFRHNKKRLVKWLTSKWELARPLAVSIYKCLPKMLTWTLMYKLSIVTDHSDRTILVKPGKQK